MASTFDIGDRVRLKASFSDEGAAVDPTSVTCTVRAPDGALTSPGVSKDDVGRYSAEVAPDSAGAWLFRFEGTGAYVAAEEREFFIRERLVP